jgi:RNA polymerase sigma-70 factor (ECF subfamily)
MERYCGGDREAFGLLYGRLAPKLFGYLNKLTADRATAEDLLQQAFLKLHHSRANYVAGADPEPWLYTIARHAWVDELRRRKRSRSALGSHVAPPTDAPDTADDSQVGLDPLLHGQRVCGAVDRALSSVPDNQRGAFVLTKLEGLTHAQAAKVLGTTPGAVKLRVHRACERLRSWLSGLDAEGSLGEV